MKQIAIKVSNISVSYDQNQVLTDTSFSLQSGSICGLVGMNGSGKSTLFKVIMGIVEPKTGTITVNGLSLREAQKKGVISYVPQSEDIDWQFPLTVWDVVMMGRYGYMNVLRSPSSTDIEKIKESLHKVQMYGFKDKQIGELSGGQRKRVFLARTLAQGASIMLLDEPFSGVDAKTEAAITTLLLELKKKGATILISTHELTSLTEYCDHVVLIKHTVIAFGKTDDVFTPENVSKTFDGMIHRLAFGNKPVDIHH